MVILHNWYLKKQWPYIRGGHQWPITPPWYYIVYTIYIDGEKHNECITGPLQNIPNKNDKNFTFTANGMSITYDLGRYNPRHDAATKITSMVRMAKCRRFLEMYKNLMCHTRVPREVILDEILTYVIN